MAVRSDWMMDKLRGSMMVDPMAVKMVERWVDWSGEYLDKKMVVQTAVTMEHATVALSDHSSVVEWATLMAARSDKRLAEKLVDSMVDQLDMMTGIRLADYWVADWAEVMAERKESLKAARTVGS